MNLVGAAGRSKTFLTRFASYDVLVVGGGPGGYPASIRAAQRGLKVGNVEMSNLGGTCLNVGCIPSKSLLNASSKYAEAKKHFKTLGIKGGNKCQVDMPALQKNKNNTIKSLVSGIGFLFKKNKVESIPGRAFFDASGKLKIESPDGTVRDDVDAKNVVLAVGSMPTWFPGMNVDGDRILTSEHALSLKKIPQKMIVIGGGVIGVELGTVYSRLGTEVEVIEFMPRIVPSVDLGMAKSFQKVMTKQGMKFRLSTKVKSASTEGDRCRVVVENAKGEETVLEADVCLIAVGRKPNTENLGLENVGVSVDRRGMIPTDSNYNVQGAKTDFKLFAIGDCIDGPMLAHKAEEDGIALADMLAKAEAHRPDYNTCPQVIYTEPEVAGVGLTEEQLKEKKIQYKAASFSQGGNSRSKVIGQTDGEVKLLYDPQTLKVLGAWVMGASAGELIHQISALMHSDRTLKDLSTQTISHPTLSEAVKEAAMIAVDGFPIHN